MCECLITWKRVGLGGAVIKDALDEEAALGGDAQAIERSRIRVSFASSGVAGDNPPTVCAMTVTIGTIGYVGPVILETGHSPPQVRVHGVGVAGVEPGIRHTNSDPGA